MSSSSAESPESSESSGGSALTVAVVVLAFDSPAGMLEAAVDSVLSSGGPVIEVIVVDNGSDARRRLGDRIRPETVTLIDSPTNGGYGAGVNLGIDRALERGADAVALLNDDVTVCAGWLEPLVAELMADSNVGAVQPTLLQAGRTDVVNSAGVSFDPCGQAADIARGRPAVELSQSSSDVPAFTGGAVVIRRDFFESVGRFDERFFLYYEDVELSRRGAASWRKWRYRHVPTSLVEHHGSASSQALGDGARRLQERNRLWTSVMHGSRSEVIRGLWLSIRRLRHRPRRIHAGALLSGMAGMPRRLAARAGGRARLVRVVERIRGRTPTTPAIGVNVVGYHHVSSGLGSNAREMSAALRAAGVACIDIDNDLTSSPLRRSALPAPDHVFDTTIAIVTAFEFPYFVHRFPQLVGPGKRLIGLWVWELDQIPAQHLDALALVDEIWAPTRFVQDAYAQVAGEIPVRLSPFRMEEPPVDDSLIAAWRNRFDGDFTFLVSFDYLSIVERKNPLGAIAAFSEAFADEPDLNVRLVVKSINGEQRPDDVAAIESAAQVDGRVDLLDEHLDDAQHHALLAAADCFVSLHRSEGYGLHPALAMWFGTPVIATRYSGVVDFMDDTCAAMVDFRMVPVSDGQGIYPDTAEWADPNRSQAARWMQRLVEDESLRTRLAGAGRARIAGQPGRADFGAAYAAMLQAPRDAVDPFFDGLDAVHPQGSAWPDSARRH